MANKKETLRLINYLIDNMSMWHINYARVVLIPSEVDKLIKEHEKFDDLLRKRGEFLVNSEEEDTVDDLETYNEIMNTTEDEKMIQSIDIYTTGRVITVNKQDYTKEELDIIENKLEIGVEVKLESDYKKLCIPVESIVGYEVTYVSQYEEKFKTDIEK